jgi:ketosteroid isomerase-like protein
MNDGKGIEKGHASRRPGPEQRPGPEDVLSEFGESWQELQDCDGTDGWADQDTVKLALLAAAKPKRGVAALSIGALLAVFGAAGLTWFNIGTDSAPSPRAPEVPRPQPPVTASLGIVPVASAPAPQASVASTAAPAEDLVLDESPRVLETVEQWRQAWVARDAASYLGFYSPNFVPARGQSHAAWQAARRKALDRPAGIEITLRELRLQNLNEDQIKVDFLQDYTSGPYREVAQAKTLILARSGARWLIAREWQGTP